MTPAARPPGAKNGSGRFGTPCLRMHCALATIPASCALDSAGQGPLALGCRLAHACWADRKAGACGSMAKGRLMLPFAPGSGKFGAPCERMQSA